jgi:hypothetical protein
MDVRQEIFPARRIWPQAIHDVSEISAEATEVRLVSRAKNLRKLSTLTRLKALWCFDINHEALDSICNCVSLESLFIENLKTGDVACLKSLRNLSTLSLDSCSKITSLEFLVRLPALRGLAIINFKNVHDLTPVAAMTSLRFLAIAGSMWTRMKVASFDPLSHLPGLEFLHLTNIKADDSSLEPLATLSHLKLLDIANFYPMNEFARLSRKLSTTECTWFHPFLAVQKSMVCKKCRMHTMVMLTGRRNRILCTDCDGERLERHIKEWNYASAERSRV